MTLDELKVLKGERDLLKKELESAKGDLKKLMDIVPLVIAGPRLDELIPVSYTHLTLPTKA